MAAAPKSTHVGGADGPTDVAGIVKDLIITGLLALAILGPIVGLKTVAASGTLALQPRWGTVAVLVAITMAGRLLIHLYGLYAPKAAPKAAKAKPQSEVSIGKYVAPVLLLVAFALPFLAGMTGSRERQIMDLAILIMTYIMLGWGLNIVVGLAGLLDLGYVAFYAVGAYTYALLATVFFPYWFGDGILPWAFFLTLPIAGLLAALWGVILGFPVLRLRGDYLAIVTLAFGEIIRVVLLNWVDFTGGPNGISGIPRPSFFGLPFQSGEGSFADFFGIEHKPIHRIVFLYYIILVLALVTNLVTMRLRKLPVGRAWEALREDEIACRSLGINTTNTKLTAFALGAMFGGFAGSFFAVRQGFVSPESFTFIESATILAVVVLGGMGSQIGVALAAVIMIGGTELLRELEWTKHIFGDDFDPAQYRMLIFGVAMVIMMIWKPRGIISTRTPSAFLKERKAVSGDLVQEGHG